MLASSAFSVWPVLSVNNLRFLQEHWFVYLALLGLSAVLWVYFKFFVFTGLHEKAAGKLKAFFGRGTGRKNKDDAYGK